LAKLQPAFQAKLRQLYRDVPLPSDALRQLPPEVGG
jgi:hypothetical protein